MKLKVIGKGYPWTLPHADNPHATMTPTAVARDKVTVAELYLHSGRFLLLSRGRSLSVRRTSSRQATPRGDPRGVPKFLSQLRIKDDLSSGRLEGFGAEEKKEKIFAMRHLLAKPAQVHEDDLWTLLGEEEGSDPTQVIDCGEQLLQFLSNTATTTFEVVLNDATLGNCESGCAASLQDIEPLNGFEGSFTDAIPVPHHADPQELIDPPAYDHDGLQAAASDHGLATLTPDPNVPVEAINITTELSAPSGVFAPIVMTPGPQLVSTATEERNSTFAPTSHSPDNVTLVCASGIPLAYSPQVDPHSPEADSLHLLLSPQLSSSLPHPYQRPTDRPARTKQEPLVDYWRMRADNNRACRKYRRRRKEQEQRLDEELRLEAERNQRLRARLRLVEGRKDRLEALLMGMLMGRGAPVKEAFIKDFL